MILSLSHQVFKSLANHACKTWGEINRNSKGRAQKGLIQLPFNTKFILFKLMNKHRVYSSDLPLFLTFFF